nr:SlyX family protein [Roseicitreum antarcticum]
MLAAEEQLAHLSRAVEDLSHIVTAQADEIDLLTRRVAMLLEHARDRQDTGSGAVVLGDERPPHW